MMRLQIEKRQREQDGKMKYLLMARMRTAAIRGDNCHSVLHETKSIKNFHHCLVH